MNTQSPLVPQGSLLEQKNKGRARVKVAVFLVLAFHGVGVLALLMTQGCKQDKGPANEEAATTNSNQTQAFEQPSNPVVAPTNMAAPETNTAVATAPPSPAPPVQAQDYVIAQGDTLSGLAKKFGVSVKALVDANPGIEPTKLKIGQKIHIPPAAPAATATAAPTSETTEGEQNYTVKSGDTLSSIAKQFGVRVRAIRNANSLTSDRIIVGQKLKIPAKTAATAAPAGTSAPPDTASPAASPK